MTAGPQLTQISLQNVAFDQNQAAGIQRIAKFLAEIVNQHRVDFDGDNLFGTLQQGFRKRTAARADFDDQRGSLTAFTCGLSDPIKRRFTI